MGESHDNKLMSTQTVKKYLTKILIEGLQEIS